MTGELLADVLPRAVLASVVAPMVARRERRSLLHVIVRFKMLRALNSAVPRDGFTWLVGQENLTSSATRIAAPLRQAEFTEAAGKLIAEKRCQHGDDGHGDDVLHFDLHRLDSPTFSWLHDAAAVRDRSLPPSCRPWLTWDYAGPSMRWFRPSCSLTSVLLLSSRDTLSWSFTPSLCWVVQYNSSTAGIAYAGGP